VGKSIEIKAEVPGPRSKALLEERRKWVSAGVSEAKHGIFFERAEGARLVDVDGNVYLDWTGGIGCMNSGHSNPEILGRARAQLEKLQHTCFQVAPYEPYVSLARKLCQIAPGTGPKKAALFNSGAEAVENAIKIARKATGRTGVLAFDPGFHGRTLLALTLTSKTNPYRDGFGPFAPEVYRFPLPDVYRRPRELSEKAFLENAIAEFHRFLKSSVTLSQIACAIIEPEVGEGGFIPVPRAFLDDLVKVCRENKILLVADEVQTGFGRTGTLFASEQLGLDPDLVVLAKSLSGGFPLSAVVGRAAIMDSVQPGGLGGTFGGNAVACAAALAAIEAVEKLLPRAVEIGRRVNERFLRFQEKLGHVGDVRGLGAMRALEIVKDKTSREPDKERTEKILLAASRRGLLLLSAGLHGNVIRTLMPLVATDDEIEEALSVFEVALAS
jgi:4-aminobutyrate aminotransferase/(S)-3-amino-2-methylpropionate transaminase